MGDYPNQYNSAILCQSLLKRKGDKTLKYPKEKTPLVAYDVPIYTQDFKSQLRTMISLKGLQENSRRDSRGKASKKNSRKDSKRATTPGLFPEGKQRSKTIVLQLTIPSSNVQHRKFTSLP